MYYNDTSKKPLKGGAVKQGASNYENDDIKSLFINVIQEKFGNIKFLLQLFVIITPYFTVFLFVLLSIINSNIKGFIYVTGLFFVFGLINMFKLSNAQTNKDVICKQLDKYHGDNPSFVIGLYSYTIIYMLLPMILNNTFNMQLIVILFIIFVSDIIIRKNYFKCLIMFDIMKGVIFGTLIGAMWAYTIKVSGNKSLLYTQDMESNKTTCQKVKTNFTCNIVKQTGDTIQKIPIVPQGDIVPK
jgi:hypothetical protein